MELKELAVSGILIDVLSENVVIIQGGETLKLEYYEQEQNNDYTLQNETSSGTYSLVLRRVSPATSDTTARPISIRIPENRDFKNITVKTNSGSTLISGTILPVRGTNLASAKFHTENFEKPD